MKKKILNIKAKNRKLNNKTSYYLRKKKNILCVLYNKNIKNNIYFYIKDKLKHYYYHKYKFYNIFYKKNIYLSLIKEIQYHPVNDKIIHIDFLKINTNEIITTYINIKFIGKSIGIIKGGILEIIINKIKIKSYYKYIPNYIKIDISNLNINDKIFIKDILNKKYNILNNRNNIICFIKFKKNIKEKKK
ncbi:MAG: 50S ribosomal protein L25 [Candidatus Shikimatogenerans sp. Tcar]|uniref:50S ribosomal protein L25 n=1 Tax=Candidatus Shikimatogenerans sp. Tcar TaxID=3158565 RepID=A0AAU7QS18_9FLAO